MPGEKGNSIGAQETHHTEEPRPLRGWHPKVACPPLPTQGFAFALDLHIFKGMVNGSIMTSTVVPSRLPALEVEDSTDFGPGSFKRKFSSQLKN